MGPVCLVAEMFDQYDHYQTREFLGRRAAPRFPATCPLEDGEAWPDDRGKFRRAECRPDWFAVVEDVVLDDHAFADEGKLQVCGDMGRPEQRTHRRCGAGKLAYFPAPLAKFLQRHDL
jgi:hypothetical protein